MPEELVRLSKLMTERGLASRREADMYIAAGSVYVDGIKVDVLGTKVSPSSIITLDTDAKQDQQRLVTIILNKPVGYVSTQPEKGYKEAIQLITPENQWGSSTRRLTPENMQGLSVCGRLDIESQGVLLLTQDGRIAKQIIGENSDLEKEYIVRVEGELPENKMKMLQYGLMLDGKILRPAVVEWINEDQLRFILKEGKKRQIRRMCEMVGLKVTGLKRVRIGNLRLGNLPEGKWRFMEATESL
ncbi:MAG: pseudouridine synthase [Patescibacteria group bacterium]